MKFYRAQTEGGPRLESTQAEAKALDPNFERIDIPTDHDGLKAYVQALWDENHQLRQGGVVSVAPPVGELPEREEMAATSPPPPVDHPAREAPYTTQSISFEDAFDGMPLALQLHYAALALENARSAIKPLKPVQVEEAA